MARFHAWPLRTLLLRSRRLHKGGEAPPHAEQQQHDQSEGGQRKQRNRDRSQAEPELLGAVGARTADPRHVAADEILDHDLVGSEK